MYSRHKGWIFFPGSISKQNQDGKSPERSASLSKGSPIVWMRFVVRKMIPSKYSIFRRNTLKEVNPLRHLKNQKSQVLSSLATQALCFIFSGVLSARRTSASSTRSITSKKWAYRNIPSIFDSSLSLLTNIPRFNQHRGLCRYLERWTMDDASQPLALPAKLPIFTSFTLAYLWAPA